MGVPPLPWPVFWDQYLSWVLPARSLRNKGLEVKSLFFFHLGTFRCRLGLRDGRFCFLPTLDPHFVPIKKSSLTRPRPGEGAFSCVMASGANSFDSAQGRRQRRKARRLGWSTLCCGSGSEGCAFFAADAEFEVIIASCPSKKTVPIVGVRIRNLRVKREARRF